MKKIIDTITEWKENTDVDIKSDHIDESQKQDYIRQSIALSMAIGLLSNLGNNNNIPKL